MSTIEKAFSAIYLKRFGRGQDIQPFLSKIDINAVNEYKENLLHEAVASKDITSAKQLLKAGINVNQQNYEGMVPLHYCASDNNFDIAKEILKHSPDLSIEDKYGNQPLWTAVFNAHGRYDMVKAFISHGADPHHKNKNNKSPLDFANQIKNPQLIALLKG